MRWRGYPPPGGRGLSSGRDRGGAQVGAARWCARAGLLVLEEMP